METQSKSGKSPVKLLIITVPGVKTYPGAGYYCTWSQNLQSI